MKHLTWLAVVAFCALLSGVQGFAADEKKADGKETTIFRSVDLINKAVRNDKNEDLGKLEDFVINMKDGHIVYAAIGYGETLGFGGKLFAVPPQALSVSKDGMYVVLNVNKDEFEKGTGFDANKWPMAPDAKWGTSKAARDEKPLVKEDTKEPAHLRRLTSLVGTAIKDKDGNTLGSAAAFGVDLDHSKIAYVALGYGGVAGVGAKYFAIPWDALEMKSFDLKSAAKNFVLDAKKTDFEGQPGFDWNRWPNQADKKFMKTGK